MNATWIKSKFKIIVFDKISFLALHEASQKLIRLTCVAISFLFCYWSLHTLLWFRATRNIKIAFSDTTIMLKIAVFISSYGQKFACKIFEIIMISLPRSSYFKSRAFQVCQNESLNWIEEVVAWHTRCREMKWWRKFKVIHASASISFINEAWSTK